MWIKLLDTVHFHERVSGNSYYLEKDQQIRCSEQGKTKKIQSMATPRNFEEIDICYSQPTPMNSVVLLSFVLAV